MPLWSTWATAVSEPLPTSQVAIGTTSIAGIKTRGLGPCEDDHCAILTLRLPGYHRVRQLRVVFDAPGFQTRHIRHVVFLCGPAAAAECV